VSWYLREEVNPCHDREVFPRDDLLAGDEVAAIAATE